MAKAEVKCPYCGKKFERLDNEEHIVWERGDNVKLDKRRYFHKECVELAHQTPKTAWPEYLHRIELAGSELDVWAAMCYDFLTKDMKMEAEYNKIRNQIEAFTKKHMKYEGIFRTVCYCYAVKHLDKKKAEGGIGIVPYLYEEAAQWFVDRTQKQEKFVMELNKQIEERKAAVTIFRQKRDPARGRQKINLAEME